MLLQEPAALVDRLRAFEIETRVRAEAELAQLGAPAEAALEAASRESDPEVAARARRLLLEVVAPHRREIDRARRHLQAHLDGATGPAKAALLEILRRNLPDPSRYPSREAWMQSRGPLREAVAATLPAGSVCVPCIEWRLETLKVGLAFENAKVEDILAHLRDVGGVNLILDAGLDEPLNWDRAVTIEAKDVTLAEALKRVLGPYGMGFQVTEEGVVLIGTRWKSAE